MNIRYIRKKIVALTHDNFSHVKSFSMKLFNKNNIDNNITDKSAKLLENNKSAGSA